MVATKPLKEALSEYSAGKKPLYYIPLIVLFSVHVVQLIQYQPNEPVGILLVPMSLLYFGLHELAHAFTMSLPSLLTASAGSLSEIAFGILIVFAMIRSRLFFAALYGMIWLGFACKDTGIYMSDATMQELSLFSPFGDNAVHDWNYVFTKLDVIQYDWLIGGAFIIIGYLCAAASVVGAVWLVHGFMHQQQNAAKIAHSKDLAEQLRASQGFVSDSAGVITKGPLADRSLTGTDSNSRKHATAAQTAAGSSGADLYPVAIKGVLSYDAASEQKKERT
jgi:hypothetical protein